MNLIKNFWNKNTINQDDDFEDYDEIYRTPSDIQIPGMEGDENVSALGSTAPAPTPVSADKVSLKLLQPKSHTEATMIADKLKEGCIVLLDISHLNKDQAHRLVDFLAGVAYVLDGEMIKTNKSTIVISPAGVDISGFAPTAEEAPAAAPAEEAPVAEEYEEYNADAENN